ncbi:ribonuclease Z [Methanococcus voltae]|uniref:Ribonuclease Z n=1 Tax=Methanococcus voltae (strain ATCC BAA-1334 / A3) TaxID=456320 RepID=D7DSH6_METV3|nr:ribonuclease Z [Methanococcus voltae]MCS3901612.1 ribonuclease Z [Methanococcus voltae]
MILTFLGTSASVPTKERAHTGLALRYNGEYFLFDCGENVQRQMMSTNVSPMKINNIFISHLHGDHILGLGGLLQSMALSNRKKPLKIFGPPKITETVENILKIGYHSISYDIEVVELELKPNKILSVNNSGNGYEIYCYPTNHSVPSLAYIFKELKAPKMDMAKVKNLGIEIGSKLKDLKDGKSVEIETFENGKSVKKTIIPQDVLVKNTEGVSFAYSGDTRPVYAFAMFLKDLNCKVLVHEATFDSSLLENALETMHSTFGEALKISEISEVKQLIITHISARYRSLEAYESEINDYLEKSTLHGKTLKLEIAKDFLEYDLKKLKVIKPKIKDKE